MHVAMAPAREDAPPRVDVTRYIGWVKTIARKHVGKGVDLDDLIQVGCLGAIRAEQLYDPARGEFSTYSEYWIRAYILAAIETSGWPLRLPRNAVRNAMKRPETSSARAIRFILDAGAIGGGSIKDLVEARARTSWQPDLAAMQAEDPLCNPEVGRAFLERAMAYLTGRHRHVLARYYGLDDRPASTLDQIALELGISKERVRQIREDALARIRKRMGVKP